MIDIYYRDERWGVQKSHSFLTDVIHRISLLFMSCSSFCWKYNVARAPLTGKQTLLDSRDQGIWWEGIAQRNSLPIRTWSLEFCS
jgi:hypothetical protein